MFDFGWHLRGSVPLDGVSRGVIALDRVEQLLERQRKTITERGEDYLVFDNPLWTEPFGPNWLAMGIYDRGRFWIERGLHEQRLRYDLRSLHGMAFCLFGALMVFFVGLAGDGLLSGTILAVGAFAWLYGMNLVLAFVRVPNAIRKAVTG